MLQPRSIQNQSKLIKTVKPRSVGFRQITCKNQKSIEKILKHHNDEQNIKSSIPYPQNLNVKLVDESSKNLYQKNNDNLHSQNLLQKCLKPQITQLQNKLIYKNFENQSFIEHFKYQHNCIDSNAKIDKKGNIKIGNKPQKYKLNKNKNNNYHSCQKQLEKSQNVEHGSSLKKTQRKNSPNIFLCAKKFVESNQLQVKLKKFEQDLKKTKKPNTLRLHRQTPNTSQLNLKNNQKKIVNLVNHYISPKPQSVISKNLKYSPFYNIDSKNSSFTVLKQQILPTKNFTRQQVHALQKTKKIVNHNIESLEVKTPKKNQNISTMQIQYKVKNKQLQDLLSQQQVKFIMKRMCIDLKSVQKEDTFVDQKQTKAERKSIQKYLKSQSLVSINYSVGKQSFQQQKELQKVQAMPSSKINISKVQLSTFKQFNIQNLPCKQSYTLRTTDNPKHQNKQLLIEDSARSQRRNSVMKTGQKPISSKNRLQRLDQGAKTIITKYDSSQKRSVLQESIIIFQCSKDLRISFSKQKLKDYAQKYRGSLGDQILIRQNQDQYNNMAQSSQKQANSFERIVINSSNSRVRKSYSIHNEYDYAQINI